MNTLHLFRDIKHPQLHDRFEVMMTAAHKNNNITYLTLLLLRVDLNITTWTRLTPMYFLYVYMLDLI